MSDTQSTYFLEGTTALSALKATRSRAAPTGRVETTILREMGARGLLSLAGLFQGFLSLLLPSGTHTTSLFCPATRLIPLLSPLPCRSS